MSIEAAKSFIERTKTDEAFAKKVAECKDAREQVAFGQNEGFIFTVDEVKKAGQELCDTDLKKVAGGQSSRPQTINPEELKFY